MHLKQLLIAAAFAGLGFCATIPTSSANNSSAIDQSLAAKIARARAAGPPSISKDASIGDYNTTDHSVKLLKIGTNKWTCFPGDASVVGYAAMCADPMGLMWAISNSKKLPAPLNPAPGLIYMLSGAVQHSNTDPFDTTSPGIPIAPHFMIIWPFNSKRDGIPKDIRPAGSWIMFDGTPYAYLHVTGSPWA